MKKVDLKEKKFFTGAKGAIAAKVEGPNWFHTPPNQTFPESFEDLNLYKEGSLEKFIKKHLLLGYSPQEKLFSNESKIFTMGSCFAANIAKELESRHHGTKGFSKVLHTPSSVNNTFALEQFFRWVITGDVSDRSYWHEGKAKGWEPDGTREAYLDWISQADGFIFTLGLSEIWKDKKTNKVFWRAVPHQQYDKDVDRYSFELSTVEQNVENIRNLIRLIHHNLGDKPIILTLSPVPLRATFRNMSCISANCVSKSILRVALNEVMASEYDHVYYWPSYEVIKEISTHKNQSGFESKIPRHPKQQIVKGIISTFLSVYFK